MNSFSKIFGKRRSSSKAKDDEAGEVDIEAARMELAQAALAPFPPGFSATDPAQLKAFKESQLATLNKYVNPLPNEGMVAWFKPESWRDGDKQWHDASGHGHVGRATADILRRRRPAAVCDQFVGALRGLARGAAAKWLAQLNCQ